MRRAQPHVLERLRPDRARGARGPAATTCATPRCSIPNTAATPHARPDRRARGRDARGLPRPAARSRCARETADGTPAELVSAAIDAAEREGPAVVVAIDGPGGAGKSTLARELALLRDDVAIIEGDDFYRPLTESTRAALTPLEAVDLLFDWERLRDEALAPLAARRGRALPPLRLGGRAPGRGRRDRRPARASCVVEGVYVARPGAARLPRPDRRRRRPARALPRAAARARRGRAGADRALARGRGLVPRAAGSAARRRSRDRRHLTSDPSRVVGSPGATGIRHRSWPSPRCSSARRGASAAGGDLRVGSPQAFETPNPFKAVEAISVESYATMYYDQLERHQDERSERRLRPQRAGEGRRRRRRRQDDHVPPARRACTGRTGKPFTSADALWTFNAVLKNKTNQLHGRIEAVKSVSAPDANTFVMHLSTRGLGVPRQARDPDPARARLVEVPDRASSTRSTGRSRR